MEPVFNFLCESKNGVKVYYDPISSHAATHLEDTPELKELVIEVIGNLNLQGDRVAKHVDTGRIVGTTDVVEVDGSDVIVYGVRKNRENDGLVPFTKSRPPKPSTYITVQLDPQPDETYILASAWIGTWDDDDEPFPQSLRATAKSKDYWHRYAFVYGSQKIVPGTETAETPW